MQDPARPWHVHLEHAGLPWSHASLDFLQGSHAAFLEDILQVSVLFGFAKFVLVHRVGKELAERHWPRRSGAERQYWVDHGSESGRSQLGVGERQHGEIRALLRCVRGGTVTRSTHYSVNWAVLYTVYSTHVVWSQI